MNLQSSSPARKRFLHKLTSRSPTYYEDRLSVQPSHLPVQRNSSISISIKPPEQPSPATPTLGRSLTPTILYTKPRTPPPQVDLGFYSSFLHSLMNCRGKITESLKLDIERVSEEMNEGFNRNPEFSIQLYMKMTQIIAFLYGKEEFNMQDVVDWIEECIDIMDEKGECRELTAVQESVIKVNLKVVTTVKRLLDKQTVQGLSFAYLVLVSSIDPGLGIRSCQKLASSVVLSVMQRYTLNPSNFIQTCRKIPESLKTCKIPFLSIKYCEAIFSKVSVTALKEIDKSKVLINLYRVVQSSLAYSHKLHKLCNQNLIQDRSDPPGIRSSMSSISNHNSDLHSNSSFNPFNSNTYDSILEDRFKSFMKNYVFPDQRQVASRLLMLDEFLASIRQELRASVLPNLKQKFS